MNRREIVLGATALAACGADGQAQPAPAPFPMRRGVNLGNALEAPNEGDWGYRIELPHLDAIAAAGFDGIRLPVRWDQHMDARAVVAPAHMERVQEVVYWALARELKVQLDVHHYSSLIESPDLETQRYLALWVQIAEVFADASPALMFEPLNEPNGPLWTAASLRALQTQTLAVIRERHPNRLVVFGGPNWNSLDGLSEWRPPDGDNIATTFHYYEPHAFTHQHAEWLGAEAPTFNHSWGSEGGEEITVFRHFAMAQTLARRRGWRLQLGEFGVNRAVPLEQRAMWTRYVRELCDEMGLAWCVWDFAGAFPIWDRETGNFIPMMRDALFA